MWRSTVAGMRHRKLRLLLSGLAVVLGVTFVAGSFVLTDTLGRSFDQIFSDANSHIDVQVHGLPQVPVHTFDGEQVPANIPATTVDRVAQVPGVAAATGVVMVDGARVIGADGTVVASLGPPRLGTNWTGEDELVQLREGRGPQAPDEIAIDAALARTAGLSVGDRVGVLTLQPRQDFTLVGTIGFAGGRDSLGGVQFVAFTDDVAQQLMLGEPDVWTAVEVRAADGVGAEQLRDDIAAALGPDYQVRTGEQVAADDAARLKEGLAFLNNILLGFAGVALFVGVFLILNTFSMVVAQRVRELALMRAIGASRRQMISSVLLEALVVGLIAASIGLAAGIGVGALFARLAARMSTLPMAGLGVPLAAIVAALVVGVLVTLLAALVPALRAARVPPVAAMRTASGGERASHPLSVAGALMLLVGAGLLVWGLGGAGEATLWLVLAGVLAAFVAVALLTPLVARPVVSVIGRLFSWSVPGKLGRLNSGRNPRRTAITASALMVGVALVTGVGVILDSAKESISGLAQEAISAELVIAGEQTGPRPPTFDPAVLTEAAALSGVSTVAGIYVEQGLVDGQTVFLTAANDLGAVTETLGLRAAAGSLARLQPGQLVLDTDLAEDMDLAVGDRVEVQLPRGQAASYHVAGVYETSPIYQGFILPEEAVAGFGMPQPATGLVRLADGADATAVQEHVRALLVDSPEVSVADQSTYIDQQAAQFDTVLTMIRVLLALAIVVAALGIVNTLALSVLERTRELGLLRAVGLGRTATMRMVTVEAVVISLFGALLGVAVGTGLGAAVVRALRDQGITSLTLPWADAGFYLLLAAVIGVLAAAVPAIRAARTNVLGAIAYE